jgi:hypothetical protein
MIATVSVCIGDTSAICNMSHPQTPPLSCSVTMKGVWLSFCPLFGSKIVLRSSIGSEQTIHYSELGGCLLLGGS